MAKTNQDKQELFILLHEQLQKEGLSLPNIRLEICKNEELGLCKSPDPLHSYRARLCQLTNLDPKKNERADEFRTRLAGFKMAKNNKKENGVVQELLEA